MGARICTCLFWSFGASRAGRCEFGRVWSSPKLPQNFSPVICGSVFQSVGKETVMNYQLVSLELISALVRFLAMCPFLPFLPKGPRRTKNTTRSKFTTCSEFTIALWFTIVAHLVRKPFSWELQTFFLSKKGPRRSKYEGHSKKHYGVVIHYSYYRRRFLVRKGPLGFGKKARKTTKKTRMFYPCRTPKISGKEEKPLKETRNSTLQKTRKGRTGWILAVQFANANINFAAEFLFLRRRTQFFPLRIRSVCNGAGPI